MFLMSTYRSYIYSVSCHPNVPPICTFGRLSLREDWVILFSSKKIQVLCISVAGDYTLPLLLSWSITNETRAPNCSQFVCVYDCVWWHLVLFSASEQAHDQSTAFLASNWNHILSANPFFPLFFLKSIFFANYEKLNLSVLPTLDRVMIQNTL